MKRLTGIILFIVVAMLAGCEQQPQYVTYETYPQYQVRVNGARIAWENQQRALRLQDPSYVSRPFVAPTYYRHNQRYNPTRVIPRPVRQDRRVPVTVVVKPTRPSYPNAFTRPTGTGLSSQSRVVARSTTTTVYRPRTSSNTSRSTSWSKSTTRSTTTSRRR